MRLLVKSYDSQRYYHECVDIDGEIMHPGAIVKVDLEVWGSLKKEEEGKKLIGKTIETEECYPYISIAIRPSVIKEGMEA